MSSTDRAPEPTMEEILASIRRIISEEENNDAPDVAAADAEDDYASPPSPLGRSDAAEQTFDNPPESAPSESAALADADFTEEPLEDLEPLEAEDLTTVEDDEVLELGDLTAAGPGAGAQPPSPTFQQPPAGDAAAPQQFSPPDQAGQEPAGEEPMEAGEPLELSEDFSFPFEEEEQSEPVEPLVRETSALEAAIAALKGDQARAAEPEPQAEEAGSEEPQAEAAAPAEEPVPAEEISEASLETALQEAAEEEDVDFEAEETDEDPADDESLAEDAAAFSGAFGQERRNGTHHREAGDFAYAAGGSLEETVKAMLRPMLREWLDQNMDRLLQEALHEELQAEGKHQRN